MNLQELMSWRARTGILEQQKLANEQAMQKAVSQLDLRSPRTVYGYRPLEKKVPWFGEGGTIPTALGEIGSDAKSLFIDPMMPMIEGMKPKSPEENEKFLRGNYPELGRDIQSRIAKTGVGTRIGEQLVRRPAGYWQDKPNQEWLERSARRCFDGSVRLVRIYSNRWDFRWSKGVNGK